MPETARTPRKRPDPSSSTLGTNEAGRFAPQLPTDGRELISCWELPQTAWDTESVKVQRCVLGTNRVQLLDSFPMREFSMKDTAAEYGPGRYRLSPGPGPYSSKSVTLEISEEYARREGYGQAPPPPPPPSAQELMSRRTFEQAQTGPVDRLELAAMIETAIQRTQAQPPAADPLALIMKGFELANTFNARSLDVAKSMMGVSSPAKEVPTTFADVLLQLGPQLLDTIKSAAPLIAGAIASNTHQGPPPNMQPMQRSTAPANVQTLQTGAEPMTPQPTTAGPTMTPEEIEGTAPIMAVLRPYAGMLAAQLETGTPEHLTEQLAGLLGPDLDLSILALDDAEKKYGPAVFAHIGHGLANPKAAAVVAGLARMIRAERANPESEG